MKRLLLALSLVALTGSAFAQDWSKELEKAAKGGDVEAQVQVGRAYLKGEGVKKNTKKATQYLSKATLQGSEEAKDLLYSFYNTELIKKAWTEGDAEAQYRLGLCLLEGSEVAQDTELAAAWMEKSMEQGYKEARAKFYTFDSEVRRRRVKTLEGYCYDTRYTYIGEVIEIDKGHGGKEYYPANGECTIKSEKKGEVCEISGIWENDTLKNAVVKKTGLENKDFTGIELYGDIVFQNYAQPFLYYNSSGYLEQARFQDFTLLKGGKIVFRGYKLNNSNWDTVGSIDAIVVEDTPYDWNELYGWVEPRIENNSRMGATYCTYRSAEVLPVTREIEVTLGAEVFKLPRYRTLSNGVRDIIGKVNDDRAVNAKLRYNVGKEIQWTGCDITCQNGARVVRNMSGVPFAFYPADGSDPIDSEKGTITSANDLTVSWKHHKDCTDGRPWQVVIKRQNGAVIDVRGKELPGEMNDLSDIMSLINGYYHWLFLPGYMVRYDYDNGDSKIIDWRMNGDAQGTYTYADGSVDKVIDGFTETEIREEAERIKREEEARRKAYEEKCRKYGKTYVDAAAESKIIVGMPLELAKEVYSYSNTLGLVQLDLWAEYSNGKAIYHLLSIVNGVEASVYVENNKITDITWYIERKKK